MDQKLHMEKLWEGFLYSLFLPFLGVDTVRNYKHQLSINLVTFPCRGYHTLTRIPDVRMMVHVKLWEGLLESSWQFLIQVHFQTLTRMDYNL